jgi:prolyl-tRNA synthetase
MKDLYTFDYTHDQAIDTYKATRKAYNKLFDELKIPYLVAEADSGNMGGELSHEYHFVSPKGEDNVWSCNSCKYIANEELVQKRIEPKESAEKADGIGQTRSGLRPANAMPGNTAMLFTGISQDRTTKIEIHVPRPQTLPWNKTPGWDKVNDYINLHAVKSMGVDLDTGIEPQTLLELLPNTTETTTIYDISLPKAPFWALSPLARDLTIIRPGDRCPKCDYGRLDVQTAIEVAHTFHLGTRYSLPMNAVVAGPGENEKAHVQMGCHGIGVSRLVGAVASMLSDSRGLNWPRAIAPFEVVFVWTPEIEMKDVDKVYRRLDAAFNNTKGNRITDMVLDDRPDKSLAWKLRDADLIGYPVIVVMGRGWKANQQVEVQCRRLGFKEETGIDELGKQVNRLLNDL